MPRRPLEFGEFWAGVPLRGRLLFYLAVFFTFSVMGFASDLMGGARRTWPSLVLIVVYSGLYAVAIAAAAMRRNRLVLVAVVFGGMLPTLRWSALATRLDFPLGVPASHLLLPALGIACSTVLGYLFFVSFIAREGDRYLRAHGELAVAASVHRTVVPETSLVAGGWEWWGRSEPSGDVGGDLVDVVATAEGWAGYALDVAGHGIGAGVLMAMAKSAARAHLARERSAASLLTALNGTLAGLLESNRFATCGSVLANADGEVEIALAGHLPVLVIRARGALERFAAAEPPLGVVADQGYTSRRARLSPGDLLVVVTDGLTETGSSSGAELGIDGVADVVRRNASRELPEIFRAVREAALRGGRQEDDQTMLLLRRR